MNVHNVNIAIIMLLVAGAIVGHDALNLRGVALIAATVCVLFLVASKTSPLRMELKR